MSDNKVKYISKIVADDDAFRAQKYETKLVTSTFVKKYYNVLASLAGLNPCSRDLIDYLTEVMDDNNYVYNNSLVRKAFLDYLEKVTKQPDGTFITYSDVNIKKSYQYLTERNCLIKLTKGMFKVNPEFYFRADEKKRLGSIKLLLEFQKGFRNYKMETLYTLKEDTTEYKLNK